MILSSRSRQELTSLEDKRTTKVGMRRLPKGRLGFLCQKQPNNATDFLILSLFPSVYSLLFFPKVASLSLTSPLTSKTPSTIPPHPSPPASNATPPPTSFPPSTSPPSTSSALSLPSSAASPASPSSPSTTTPSTPPSPPISPRVRTSLGSTSPRTSSQAPCPPPSPTSFFLLIHHLSRRISGPDRLRTRRRERLGLGEAGLEVGREDGIGEAGAVDGEGRRKKEVKKRGEETEGKREGIEGKGE